jgi:hypothetical protein
MAVVCTEERLADTVASPPRCGRWPYGWVPGARDVVALADAPRAGRARRSPLPGVEPETRTPGTSPGGPQGRFGRQYPGAPPRRFFDNSRRERPG